MLDTSTSFGPGQCAHARPDVHGDPADVIAADLALAGVQSGAHLDAEGLHRVALARIAASVLAFVEQFVCRSGRPLAAVLADRPPHRCEEPLLGVDGFKVAQTTEPS